MKIYFNITSLEMFQSKMITGEISLNISEGIYFPEKKWNDNIVVILNSWMKNVIEFKDNISSIRFYFMDGPFYFIIHNNNLQLFKNNTMIGIHEINLRLFYKELGNCAENIYKELEKNNWSSNEIEELYKLLKKYKINL